jgi:hypothetical protein
MLGVRVRSLTTVLFTAIPTLGANAPSRSRTLLIQRTLHPDSRPVQHVRVNHRGAHVLVTKKFLNRANVVAMLEQVRRKRMPQRVTTCRFINLRHAHRRSLRQPAIHFHPHGGSAVSPVCASVEMRTEGKTNCHGQDVAEPSYLRSSACGRCTSPNLSSKSCSCCAFTLTKCRWSGAAKFTGNIVTRSFEPLASRTMIRE